MAAWRHDEDDLQRRALLPRQPGGDAHNGGSPHLVLKAEMTLVFYQRRCYRCCCRVVGFASRPLILPCHFFIFACHHSAPGLMESLENKPGCQVMVELTTTPPSDFSSQEIAQLTIVSWTVHAVCSDQHVPFKAGLKKTTADKKLWCILGCFLDPLAGGDMADH